jgi:hypothetical protein
VVEEDSQDALVCGIKWTLLGRFTLAEIVNLILANPLGRATPVILPYFKAAATRMNGTARPRRTGQSR